MSSAADELHREGSFKRRQLEVRLEAFIVRGLDALDAGADIPASCENDPQHEWLAPGRYRDLDLTVDLERIRRIAAARGLDETAVLNAAVRLGRKKGN
jgi:hypothetical protein